MSTTLVLSDEERDALVAVLKDAPDARLNGIESRLTDPHMDLDQHYEAGVFWTRCACGLEFGGVDPDEADANQMGHRDNEGSAWVRSWKS